LLILVASSFISPYHLPAVLKYKWPARELWFSGEPSILNAISVKDAPNMAHRVYKYRIYPSKRQTQTWRLNRISCGYYSQSAQMKEIRAIRPDVESINANILENVLKRVDLAFKAFFRRVKAGQKAGYPRFKSSRRYDSMTLRQVGNALTGNKLRISKVGQVRIKLHRPIDGVIKTLTIKREGRHWFALFACEYTPEPLPFNPNMIGVDVGLTHFATLSDGTEIENPRYYRKAERKLRVAQRRLARRKKGSRGRRDAVTLLQGAHALVRGQRRDFHHRISRWLVNNFGLIAVEDLNVKGLARGMLAKSVHDAGWGQFFGFGSYKAEDAGRLYLKVIPNGTSQECVCGASVPKTLSQRWHQCDSCGVSGPRDHISSQVILGRAVRLQDSTWPVAASVS
jgi:putative transposase